MMGARDLAAHLGLKRHPRSWRGRCPACDYSGTFSVRAGRDGRALLFCASCQDRDALADAVVRATGQERPCEPHDDLAAQFVRQRKQDAALRLWRGSEPAAGTLADHYLSMRGLPRLAASPALRFRGDCHHPEGGRYPALVALVVDAAGAPISVHRSYLRRDGSGKADTEPTKASLGPVWGGAIRLDPLASELVVGEGIESSASAGRLMGLPAWAAVSSGNLRHGLVLPPEARRVVIAADPDPAGQDAARDAWFRWCWEGRSVKIATPDREGCDFNDLLMTRGADHA